MLKVRILCQKSSQIRNFVIIQLPIRVDTTAYTYQYLMHRIWPKIRLKWHLPCNQVIYRCYYVPNIIDSNR